MEWKIWLLKDNKIKGIFAIVVILIFSFLANVIFGAFFSFLSLVILTASLNNFLFPIRYKVDERKLIVEKLFYTREIPVEWIKRVEKIKEGVFVSPFKKRKFLDNFRGIMLITKNRDEVYEYIKKIIAQRNV